MIHKRPDMLNLQDLATFIYYWSIGVVIISLIVYLALVILIVITSPRYIPIFILLSLLALPSILYIPWGIGKLFR